MGTSPTELVRRSVVEQLSESLAAVVAAGEGTVMLAAVGAGAVEPATVERLRGLADGLEAVLREVDPQAETTAVNWDLFLSRLGHQSGRTTSAAKDPAPAEEKPSVRDIVLKVARRCPDVYFTPLYVYEVLLQDPEFDTSGYPDLRKAVQNAAAGLARSKKIVKATRGQYIVPGREQDAADKDAGFDGRDKAAGRSFHREEHMNGEHFGRHAAGGKAA